MKTQPAFSGGSQPNCENFLSVFCSTIERKWQKLLRWCYEEKGKGDGKEGRGKSYPNPVVRREARSPAGGIKEATPQRI